MFCLYTLYASSLRKMAIAYRPQAPRLNQTHGDGEHMATATVCAAASPGLDCCWLGTHPTESAATHTLPSNCLEQKLTYYLYFVAKCSASTLSPGSSTLSLLLTWYFSRIMINSTWYLINVRLVMMRDA